MLNSGDVWQALEKKNYQYLPFWGGYQSPCGKIFFTQDTLYRWPGDIMYFLDTGFVRNPKIFDNGIFTPKPELFGMKSHKDGTYVAIRRVK